MKRAHIGVVLYAGYAPLASSAGECVVLEDARDLAAPPHELYAREPDAALNQAEPLPGVRDSAEIGSAKRANHGG